MKAASVRHLICAPHEVTNILPQCAAQRYTFAALLTHVRNKPRLAEEVTRKFCSLGEKISPDNS
jgi:hypothetical protein